MPDLTPRLTLAELRAGYELDARAGRLREKPRAGGGRHNSRPAPGEAGTTPAARQLSPARPHKYGAERGVEGPDLCGGTRRYDSRKGARLAVQLDQERLAGGIVSAIPEVSVPVGEMGGRPIRHRVDFLVILDVRPDGSFVGRVVEAKGFPTPMGERKRKAFERRYGVPVKVV